MIEQSDSRHFGAFSRWLRTGKPPAAPGAHGIELKFNQWHDPANGRFTFAGAGKRYGSSEADATSRASGRTFAGAGRVSKAGERRKSHVTATPKPEMPDSGPSLGHDRRPVGLGSSEVRPPQSGRAPLGNQANPVADFVGGIGEGLYDVGKEAVAGVHSLLTTHPKTTVRKAGRGLASMIDAAITAEDTPARIQVARAATAVTNASAREVGHATGTVAGNVILTAAPGAAISKVTTLRRLRMARPRTTYDPPRIDWVKETTKSDKPWKIYNDSATGARPGQAPALMRTMSDGSTRPVKFDGIQGDYVIDRKWKVVDRPRARAQILRQSEVLSQHRLTATWEVPNPTQKIKAIKLLKSMNITNIKVRVATP